MEAHSNDMWGVDWSELGALNTLMFVLGMFAMVFECFLVIWFTTLLPKAARTWFYVAWGWAHVVLTIVIIGAML